MCSHFIKFIGVTLLAIWLPLGCASFAPQVQLNTLTEPLLVVIDDQRSERQRREAAGNHYNALFDYSSDPLLARVTREIANDYNLTLSEQWPINSLGVLCFVIESPSTDVLDTLKRDERVKWVQPFNHYDVKGELQSLPQATDANVPNRTQFQEPASSDGKGINIVVIDTGMDYDHPALQNSKLRYQDFVSQRGGGRNEAHGTAVVGLIAAKRMNGQGVPNFSGFAPEASIHHFRGCWQDDHGKGRCNTLTLALALDAAVAVKPDLINLSLSGPRDVILEKLIQRLINEGGVVITAFDEKRAYDERFPTAQNGVFFAYGISDALPSNIPEYSLLAPANALSLAPNGQYDVFTGHSIATPHLTALAAKYMGDNPDSSHDDMVMHLKQWLTDRYPNYQ